MVCTSKPSYWIPSLYFAQALPYILITVVSSILYKNFAVSNAIIAFYTSLFALPWVLKPLLAPLLEHATDKKLLILVLEFMLAIMAILLALCLKLNNFFLVTVFVFLLSAFISTLHDISSDGFYIICLDKKAQAMFVGVRSLSYQFGRLVCQGGLVFIAGFFTVYYGKLLAWQLVLVVFSAMMLTLVIYHNNTLPSDKNITQVTKEKTYNIFFTFKRVYAELLSMPNILSILAFTIFYNFPESQLLKIIPLFMMDNSQQSGLGINTTMVGLIFGGVGTIGMLIGITLSGILFAKSTVKQYLVPITMFLGLTNIGYLFLSYYLPHSIWLIGCVVFAALFSYGLSNGAYMIFLLYTFGRGSYPMSSYAVGTALMSLGVMFAGAISGYMQYWLGYTYFFIWIICANICIIIFSWYKAKTI